MILRVRLTPRAMSDRIDGATEDAAGWIVQARVRAVPEKGRANAALIALLAEALHLPKSALSLAGGSKSREKRVRIDAAADSIGHALRALPPHGAGGRA
ncbi:DUF167 family protein [Aureimonas sp. AU12]|uniref:DUF167 family protein n=1 Tax=Aureimonas sp. AU12 TaxID=1638161 RepID=UPI000782A273|nr:DUF167 family protein [Aureimonas sp. AU12]